MLQTHTTSPRARLSIHTLEVLRALISVTAPYALAALALFIYHEQYFG